MTRVVTIDAARPDPETIADAAAVIAGGGLVAFPTETVYGLGVNALDDAAVARLFAAKGRPATDPLIVHIGHVDQLAQVARDIPPVARTLAGSCWPGPLTLVLHKQPVIPDSVTAGRPTVAVRVPAHAVARALIEAAGVPIAAPSANRFSRPSPTRAAHVVADLDGLVDLVLDGGPTPVGVESTIVDCTRVPPVLLRPGGLTIEALREHVPALAIEHNRGRNEEAQVAPGQMLRHYAPRARLTLFVGPATPVVARLISETRALASQGLRVGVLAPGEDVLSLAPALAAQAAAGRVTLQAYGRRAAPAEAAQALFEALRTLDSADPDVILAADIGPDDLGAAVRDRLTRAAEGRVIELGT